VAGAVGTITSRAGSPPSRHSSPDLPPSYSVGSVVSIADDIWDIDNVSTVEHPGLIFETGPFTLKVLLCTSMLPEGKNRGTEVVVNGKPFKTHPTYLYCAYHRLIDITKKSIGDLYGQLEASDFERVREKLKELRVAGRI
jgi:hypothetical protein